VRDPANVIKPGAKLGFDPIELLQKINAEVLIFSLRFTSSASTWLRDMKLAVWSVKLFRNSFTNPKRVSAAYALMAATCATWSAQCWTPRCAALVFTCIWVPESTDDPGGDRGCQGAQAMAFAPSPPGSCPTGSRSPRCAR
jgi:hypothetical protein